MVQKRGGPIGGGSTLASEEARWIVETQSKQAIVEAVAQHPKQIAMFC